MRRRTRKAEQRRAISNTTPRTLDDLQLDPQNARRHTDRNLEMIGDALDLVGAGRSIVIDEHAHVLAGNATTTQARARGLKLKVVDVDGKTVVAVRRRGLSADEKTALALFDNRAAELAEWDPAVLQALTTGGTDLSKYWSDAELRGLLAVLDTLAPGQTDADAVPATRKTSIRPGDLFQPTTVWPIPSSEVESKDHPTSKPVKIFAIPMLMHTAPGAICYEPFSGSGSQIIAAEQTGRACFAIELSPTFVQVAIDRWEAFAGAKAVKARVPHERTRAHGGRRRCVD